MPRWCHLLLFLRQVGESGKAVGVEHIEELVNESMANVKKSRATAELLERGQLKFVAGDGRQGYEPDAPYDAIHVGAAAPILPDAVRRFLWSSLRMLCAMVSIRDI